jgi:hypothetical protein
MVTAERPIGITNYELPITVVCAGSIGQPLAQRLIQSSEHHIIARYDSTLQLETGDGALWAITTRFNPAAMRVVVPVLPQWRDGARVCVRAEKISGAGCEIDWGTSTRFDPVPRSRALSTSQRVSATQTIAGALAPHSLPDALGFWDELSAMWEPFANIIASDEAISAMTKDEGRRTNIRLSSLVVRLLGRGPGLTPTGDDFLQALLVTLASGDAQDRAAFDVLRHTVTPHLSRTTRLSRAFLQEAAQGWAFGALKDVLNELPLVTQDRIDALLNIGATSGAAYVYGVLMGLSYGVTSEA